VTTSTYTNTTTRTFTHTATHLAGVITSSLAETLIAIGISVDKIGRVYDYETAISAWIEERSVASIQITITPPGGAESAAYSFEITYNAWNPDEELRDQLARLRRQLAKEPPVQAGANFAVTVVPRPGYRLSDQPGWYERSTALPSFNSGYRHGTAASGPGAAAVLRSHRIG
jgi:hypothetical protein